MHFSYCVPRVPHTHYTVFIVFCQRKYPFDRLGDDKNTSEAIAGFSPIGSYREYAIVIESEAGDSLTSVDQSVFARKERNVLCDAVVTYPSPLKTNTY